MFGTRNPRALFAVFSLLTGLCVLPFWLTHLLPMQDYPNLLLFARAFGDCHTPGSPFFGTYTTGFPLSPLVLPLLVTRAIAGFSSYETAGRVLWTLYAVGLPVASLHLLRVLRRDPWSVLLVFPLVLSYWVIGGFFAFATGMPLLLLGLATSVRWFEAPTRRRGLLLAALLAAALLWHALIFAQFALDFAVLWWLSRAEDGRARARALAPLGPALAIFVAWTMASIQGRSPGRRPPQWPPFLDNATRFFTYLGPLPEAVGVLFLLALVIAAFAATMPAAAPGASLAFRVKSPFTWLAIVSAAGYVLLPSTCFSVEGINNRQAYPAALLFVFGWSLPARRLPRALLLGVIGVGSALGLVHLAGRFAAFDRETAGASRLLDRLGPGETLFASLDRVSTISFPEKPLIELDLYASIRHGGLPNGSFAGYAINFVRYVNDQNPMPGLSPRAWQGSPGLQQFDYVLLRAPVGPLVARDRSLRLVATDGGFTLFSVCGGGTQPPCAEPPRPAPATPKALTSATPPSSARP